MYFIFANIISALTKNQEMNILICISEFVSNATLIPVIMPANTNSESINSLKFTNS